MVREAAEGQDHKEPPGLYKVTVSLLSKMESDQRVLRKRCDITSTVR